MHYTQFCITAINWIIFIEILKWDTYIFFSCVIENCYLLFCIAFLIVIFKQLTLIYVFKSIAVVTDGMSQLTSLLEFMKVFLFWQSCET